MVSLGTPHSWMSGIHRAPRHFPVHRCPTVHVGLSRGLIVAALVCWFILLPHFSSPSAHADVIATINEKIDNVLTLTAGSAGASALISAIPGDAGSPIADKLMDLSTGFLIVLAALFLEKYLIAIFSAAALGLAFPIAALFGIAWCGSGGAALGEDPPGYWCQAGGSRCRSAVGDPHELMGDQPDRRHVSDLHAGVHRVGGNAGRGAAEAEKSDEKQNEGGILGFFQDAIDTVTGGISSASKVRRSRSTSSSSRWRLCS